LEASETYLAQIQGWHAGPAEVRLGAIETPPPN
jgi:hypothetical protein